MGICIYIYIPLGEILACISEFRPGNFFPWFDLQYLHGNCQQVQTTGLTGHIEFQEGSRSNFSIDVMETSMSEGVKKVIESYDI